MAIVAELYRVDYEEYPIGQALLRVGPFEDYDAYREWTTKHCANTYGGHVWRPENIQTADEFPHGKKWFE